MSAAIETAIRIMLGRASRPDPEDGFVPEDGTPGPERSSGRPRHAAAFALIDGPFTETKEFVAG